MERVLQDLGRQSPPNKRPFNARMSAEWMTRLMSSA